MICDTVRDLLDRYQAGVLDAAQREVVEHHVRDCPSCAADLAAAQAVLPAAAQLPRAAEPSRDLWPEIAERIRPRSRFVPPLWALAAAAVMLIVASSVVTTLVLRQPGRESLAPHASVFLGPEKQYLDRTVRLVAALDSLRPKLTVETRAIIERNLATIDRALSECREALRRDPSNRVLESMLLATHERKIAILKQATSVSSEL